MLFGTTVEDLIYSADLSIAKSCNKGVNKCCYPKEHVECDSGSRRRGKAICMKRREKLIQPDQLCDHPSLMIV